MFLINLNRYPGYFKPIPQDSRNNNEDSIKDEKTGLSPSRSVSFLCNRHLLFPTDACSKQHQYGGLSRLAP
jgi:hypothetical protein